MIELELLAPAKNYEYGKAAILCGADAVYIGAPKFGARKAVGVSVEEIAKLVQFAHLFKARVYVALNTILLDAELAEAEKIIWELYEAEVDALIIQDMGLLEIKLPPMRLFASTQCDSRTAEKVRFLEEVGFERVILARELSLNKLREIRKKTKVDLETFVQGALCVTYSGQCYLSQALCGRSGNRGECGQPCRMRYDLVDAKGEVLAKNKFLLSMKDFRVEAELQNLAEAGITSFKIEGRLKDLAYVQNVTAFYNLRLNELVAKFPQQYKRAASGEVSLKFEPNLTRTFSRGFTDYFLNERPKHLSTFDTEKSRGQFLGEVREVGKWYFALDKDAAALHPGDGICFINGGNLSGTNINKVMEDGKIFPQKMDGLRKGLKLWRNLDKEFEKLLAKEASERRVRVKLVLVEQEKGFELTAEDEDGVRVRVQKEMEKSLAQNIERAKEGTKSQLMKAGETAFAITEVEVQTAEVYFFPMSVLNELRREVLEELGRERLKRFKAEEVKPLQPNNFSFPQKEVDYRANVSNQKAREFYARHGAKVKEEAVEVTQDYKGKEIARMKYCLRFELGMCKRQNMGRFKEPFYLVNNANKLRVDFDCANCEMRIFGN